MELHNAELEHGSKLVGPARDDAVDVLFPELGEDAGEAWGRGMGRVLCDDVDDENFGWAIFFSDSEMERKKKDGSWLMICQGRMLGFSTNFLCITYHIGDQEGWRGPWSGGRWRSTLCFCEGEELIEKKRETSRRGRTVSETRTGGGQVKTSRTKKVNVARVVRIHFRFESLTSCDCAFCSMLSRWRRRGSQWKGKNRGEAWQTKSFASRMAWFFLWKILLANWNGEARRKRSPLVFSTPHSSSLSQRVRSIMRTGTQQELTW